jgi:hypothetical protein
MAITIDGDGTITGLSAGGLPNNSVQTADIADDQITLAKLAGGTDGQIITYDASGNPVAVGPGSDGQILTSTGAGSPPAFEAPAAGGKILQVLSSTKTDVWDSSSDQTDITGTDQAGSGSVWCCKITPAATSSKILFLGFLTGCHSSYHGGIWVYRDSTQIAVADAWSTRQTSTFSFGATANENVNESMHVNWLDSPSSTSELTYKFKVGDHGEGGHFDINQNQNAADWAGTWLTVSSITLMEVGA